MITNLIGRVAQHQHYLFTALGNAAQADRKTISAENREDHADSFSAELISHICCDIVHAYIVSLCACDDCFGHTDHVPISRNKSFFIHCINYRARYDLCKVIALTNDRRAKTDRYRSIHSTHIFSSAYCKFFFQLLTSSDNTIIIQIQS